MHGIYIANDYSFRFLKAADITIKDNMGNQHFNTIGKIFSYLRNILNR